VAHGYPDYWAQAKPGLPMLGVEQLHWGAQNELPVAGGATVALIDSIGVAGVEYYITGGLISSDLPGITRYAEWIDFATYPWEYFDTRALLQFNPSALRRIVGTQRYRFWVNNLDTVQHTISVELHGFQINVVPGSPLVLASVGVGLAIPGAGV